MTVTILALGIASPAPARAANVAVVELLDDTFNPETVRVTQIGAMRSNAWLRTRTRSAYSTLLGVRPSPQYERQGGARLPSASLLAPVRSPRRGAAQRLAEFSATPMEELANEMVEVVVRRSDATKGCGADSLDG